jgi:hypothetical protein
MDIICAKTGRHFSSYESLETCSKLCHSGLCPHEVHETPIIRAKKPQLDIFSNVIWPNIERKE